MRTDAEYFRQYRRSDPTLTVRNAIDMYVGWNPDQAREIAETYWSEFGDGPMDMDDFLGMLGDVGGKEAFRMGLHTADGFSYEDPWVVLDAYGNPRSLSDYDYEKLCIEVAGTYAADMILEGRMDPTPELEEIIRVFIPGSPNRKAKAGKAPAKAKTAPAKAKPRAKTASGNRKKAPAKARPKATVGKASGRRRSS